MHIIYLIYVFLYKYSNDYEDKTGAISLLSSSSLPSTSKKLSNYVEITSLDLNFMQMSKIVKSFPAEKVFEVKWRSWLIIQQIQNEINKANERSSIEIPMEPFAFVQQQWSAPLSQPIAFNSQPYNLQQLHWQSLYSQPLNNLPLQNQQQYPQQFVKYSSAENQQQQQQQYNNNYTY